MCVCVFNETYLCKHILIHFIFSHAFFPFHTLFITAVTILFHLCLVFVSKMIVVYVYGYCQNNLTVEKRTRWEETVLFNIVNGASSTLQGYKMKQNRIETFPWYNTGRTLCWIAARKLC